MGSVICWKRTHILVLKIFLFHQLIVIQETCAIFCIRLLIHSFMKSFIRTDLAAEFGVSMSPCACAHACASVHMCVRAVKPEEH